MENNVKIGNFGDLGLELILKGKLLECYLDKIETVGFGTNAPATPNSNSAFDFIILLPKNAIYFLCYIYLLV